MGKKKMKQGGESLSQDTSKQWWSTLRQNFRVALPTIIEAGFALAVFLLGAIAALYLVSRYAPPSWIGNVTYTLADGLGLERIKEAMLPFANLDDGAYHFDLVSCLIVLSFGGFLARFLWSTISLQGSLLRASQFIQSVLNNSSASAEVKNVELESYFARCSHLSRAWQEFSYSSSNNKGTKKGEAADPNEAFDESIVIDSNLFVAFWTNLPGMFTATGIFGTFLGLVSTLQSLGKNPNLADLSSVAIGSSRSISTVMDSMSGMHLAFYSSLFGVGAYIIFSLVERSAFSFLSKSLSELQTLVNQIPAPDSKQSESKEEKTQVPLLHLDPDLLLNSLLQINEALRAVYASVEMLKETQYTGHERDDTVEATPPPGGER